jgi:hypothetical protein
MIDFKEVGIVRVPSPITALARIAKVFTLLSWI